MCGSPHHCATHCPLKQQHRPRASTDSYGYVCQIRDPEYSPSLTADSKPSDEEVISYHVRPGFGIFDTGATGHAISAHELTQLRSEEPGAFTDIGESRRKAMGFGGGTQTYSLGVCTQRPTEGPMSRHPIKWDACNNQSSDKPDKTTAHTDRMGS